METRQSVQGRFCLDYFEFCECKTARGGPKSLYTCTDADCKYVRARAEKTGGSRWEKVLQKNKDKKKDKKKEDK